MKINFHTAADVVKRLQEADASELETLERALANDERKTVKEALSRARRRIEKLEAEALRIEALYAFEQGLCEGTVLGLDEVGRGCVAGPLVVGGVVLPKHVRIEGLNDSKQIAPEKRKAISSVIEQVALATALVYIDAPTIDSQGMSKALRMAFAEAISMVEGRGIAIDAVLLDGNPMHVDEREINIVKGDAKCASIAAASVLAKVSRDAYMADQARLYPSYGFDINKGYAVEAHVEAIKAHGLCPIHRRSFCQNFLQESLF